VALDAKNRRAHTSLARDGIDLKDEACRQGATDRSRGRGDRDCTRHGHHQDACDESAPRWLEGGTPKDAQQHEGPVRGFAWQRSSAVDVQTTIPRNGEYGNESAQERGRCERERRRMETDGATKTSLVSSGRTPRSTSTAAESRQQTLRRTPAVAIDYRTGKRQWTLTGHHPIWNRDIATAPSSSTSRERAGR